MPLNCGIIDISCINFIKSCPSLSAGCAFPANISCTGLSELFSICVILSKSLNINVAFNTFTSLSLFNLKSIFSLSFNLISTSFLSFILVLVLGNIGLRVSFELLMLFTEMCYNIRSINKKMK